MTITVAIPTTGDRPALRQAVEAAIRSLSQAGNDGEILVVVNGRADAPGLGRIDSPLVRVVQLPKPNVSLARNWAIDHARHDVLLFSDDDGLVPEEWCSELSTALLKRDWAVVTAPVRVPVRGPVTGLINYQRIFDPPPAGPDEAHVLTGNCGLRRSLIPAHVRYDADHLPTAAEDVGFSFALRGAGLRIHWLGDAVPGLHNLDESLTEVSERGQRYGRGGAQLYLSRRHEKMAVPGALSWYAAMASGEYQDYRRFPEFTSPAVQAAFTALEYMLNAALLVGYLDECGSALGYRLIDLDAAALDAAWQEIYEDLTATAASELTERDWADLPADYTALEREPDSADPAQAAAAKVAAALRRHAPLTAGQPPAPVLAVLNPAGKIRGNGSGPAIAAAQSAQLPASERLAVAWDNLRRDGGPIGSNDFERCVRGAGLPFRRGGQELEVLLRARRRAAVS
jgi:glycosyltransferase involved in cell wall biosynthesis